MKAPLPFEWQAACQMNYQDPLILALFASQICSAGAYSRELIDNDESMGLPVNKWQIGLGIAVTLGILAYIGQLAKQALDEAEAEEA